MNCPNHPSNEITVICIAGHNCQRKYCPECQYDHGGEMNQYLPIDLFSKKLKEKAHAYKLANDQEQVKQHREFKILFANTQINLKKAFQDVNQSIQGINETIKKQAQVYLNLINTQFSLSESSYSDLDLMVKMLERNVLDKWLFSKEFYYNLFDQLKSTLKFEIEKFIRIINAQFSAILQEEQIQQQVGLKQQDQFLIKTNFQIQNSAQRETKYIYQGETLQMYKQLLQSVKQYDLLQKPEILTNLQQIKNLKWAGEVGKNLKKIGFWSALWKGENREGCGGEYSQDGYKSGKWKEMIKNYYDYQYKYCISYAKVYECGEYVNEFRSGIWNGGGEYKQPGLKNGKWSEPSEEFSNKSQATYNGEYKNGKKVSRWNTVAWGILVEGGSYDEEGSEIKNGNWIELNDKISDYSQIYYIGEYKNGQKIGKWSTWWNMKENKEIGGGSYDQGNNGMKIGKCIELSQDFQYLSQVIYQGEYLKNKKIGRWNLLYRRTTDEEFALMQQIKHIMEQGGEDYLMKGAMGLRLENGLNWQRDLDQVVELHIMGNTKTVKRLVDGIQQGQDYKCKILQGINIFSGGRSYDEKGEEKKVGRWIELNDGFWNQSQVLYEGKYKNDKNLGNGISI